MFRKSIVAAAVAISALAFIPATALAGGGHHGHGFHRGHHHHGFHRGHHHHFHHGFYGFRRLIFSGCWRVVPTRYGYAKIWVCG